MLNETQENQLQEYLSSLDCWVMSRPNEMDYYSVLVHKRQRIIPYTGDYEKGV